MKAFFNAVAKPFRATVSFLTTWFGSAMKEPDVNSRLVFLLSGGSAALCVLILTVAFIAAKDKTNYPSMVIAVGGGALGHGISRYLTKKDGGDGPGGDPPTDTSTGKPQGGN